MVQDTGFDKDLSYFRTQYQASTHLWLALHAHRRQDVQQGDLIMRHAHEACRIPKTPIPSQAPQSVQAGPKDQRSGGVVKPPAPSARRGGLRGAVKAPVASAKAKVQKVTKKTSAKSVKGR